MTKTFVMLKPDAVHRGLIGELIKRFEQKNIPIYQIKMLRPTQAQAEMHYAHMQETYGEDLFMENVRFLCSGRVVCMVLELGTEDVVSIVRSMVGSFKIADRLPGTIRGDFSCSVMHNLIHASDSAETARREIEIWFGGPL